MVFDMPGAEMAPPSRTLVSGAPEQEPPASGPSRPRHRFRVQVGQEDQDAAVPQVPTHGERGVAQSRGRRRAHAFSRQTRYDLSLPQPQQLAPLPRPAMGGTLEGGPV